jgi:hypothetical protein
MLSPSSVDPHLILALYHRRHQTLLEMASARPRVSKTSQAGIVGRSLIKVGGLLIEMGQRIQMRHLPVSSGGASSQHLSS